MGGGGPASSSQPPAAALDLSSPVPHPAGAGVGALGKETDVAASPGQAPGILRVHSSLGGCVCESIPAAGRTDPRGVSLPLCVFAGCRCWGGLCVRVFERESPCWAGQALPAQQVPVSAVCVQITSPPAPHPSWLQLPGIRHLLSCT